MLPDQYLLERQVGEEVTHVRQLRDFGAPAATDQRLFRGAAAVLVTALSAGVGHHSETHAVFLKLAHEISSMVQQRVQVK